MYRGIRRIVIALVSMGLVSGSSFHAYADNKTTDTLASMLNRTMEQEGTQKSYAAGDPLIGRWNLWAIGTSADDTSRVASEDSYLDVDDYGYTLTLQNSVASQGIWKEMENLDNTFLFMQEEPEGEEEFETESEDEENHFYIASLSYDENGVANSLALHMDGYYLALKKDDAGPSFEDVMQAENTDPFQGTPEEIYQQILASPYVNFEKAVNSLTDIETDNKQLLELKTLLEELSICRGVYIQEKDEGDEDTYTATIDYYLENGVVICHIDYNGYGGRLMTAQVERTEEEGYSFLIQPVGIFYGSEHQFHIYVAEEKMHIDWADTCEYMLYRSQGSIVEETDDYIPFEQKEVYTILSEKADEIFDDMDHHLKYVKDDAALYIYVQAYSSIRSKVASDNDYMETWTTFLSNLTELSESIGTVVTISERENSLDITEYQCKIVFVDELNSADSYSDDEILAIVAGKNITNNLKTIATPNEYSSIKPGSSTASSYSSSASMGERNALAKAQDYLDFMAFSYSGLIEQLEYEGFSYSEAKYGADYCGADWYEQAALKAADYLDFMSFSRSGLIEQLEYEGFTTEQAEYGVRQNGY